MAFNVFFKEKVDAEVDAYEDVNLWCLGKKGCDACDGPWSGGPPHISIKCRTGKDSESMRETGLLPLGTPFTMKKLPP